MALFGFKKKKENNDKSCCCNSICSTEAMKQAEMEKQSKGIKILGSGCEKCNQLEDATIKALKELGMDTTVEHIKDFEKIAAYGIMTTPALVIDGKVVSYGKVLKKNEVIEILKNRG